MFNDTKLVKSLFICPFRVYKLCKIGKISNFEVVIKQYNAILIGYEQDIS